MKGLNIIVLSVIVLVFIQGCASKTAVKPEDYTKLQEQTNTLANDNARLNSENSNLKDQNINITRDLQMTKILLSSAQDQRDILANQLSKLSNEYLLLKNQNDNSKDSLGRQITDLQASLKDRDQQMKNLQNQIGIKNSEIDDLNNKLLSLSAQESDAMKQKQAEIDSLAAMESNLQKEMQQEVSGGQIKLQQMEDVLNIDIVDKIFFDSGSADIKKNGRDVLDRIIGVLKNVTNKQIRVEGYTDNVPIADSYKWKFPSNWELSTARATTIVRYLQSQGIEPALLKATGYGEYNPVTSNDTEEGKQQNRRIVIQLLPLDVRSIYR